MLTLRFAFIVSACICATSRAEDGDDVKEHISILQTRARVQGSIQTSGWNWVVGDGQGGSEQHIGSAASLEACETMCLEKAATDSTINGCTYSNNGGTGCFVEKGMTGSNGNSAWQTSSLGPLPPTPAPTP